MKKFLQENINKIKDNITTKYNKIKDKDNNSKKIIDSSSNENNNTLSKNNKKQNNTKQEQEKNEKFPKKGYGLFCQNLINLNSIEFNFKENKYFDSDELSIDTLSIKNSTNANKSINPVFLIAVVSFHHKKGSIVEYSYPNNSDIIQLNSSSFFKNYVNEKDKIKVLEDIYYQLTYFCLPDSVHLNNEDFQFFTIQNYSKMLYGVSCYRQIKTNVKKDDIDNTRNCIQKALCILSEYPLFGIFYNKLNITISAFFDQTSLTDKQIISDMYSNYNAISIKNINVNELFLSFSLKKIISLTKFKVRIYSSISILINNKYLRLLQYLNLF